MSVQDYRIVLPNPRVAEQLGITKDDPNYLISGDVPMFMMHDDDVHLSNFRMVPVNRADRRAADRKRPTMGGKPSKGTKKDRRLKKNKGHK